jgi:hypothetical protein
VGIGVGLVPEGALGVAALADLLVALLDILALVVLLGLLWTYKHTLGAVIQFLVDHTRIHTPFGSFSLLFPLDIANNNILAGMSTAALALEVAGGRMFHALGVIFGWMVNLALYSATTMAHAVDWLKHVHIPRAIKYAASIAVAPALLVKLIADQIRKALAHEHKAVHAQVQPVAKAAHGAQTKAKAAENTSTKTAAHAQAIPMPKETAKAAAVAAPIAHGIPIPLSHDLSRIKTRLKAAEKWVAAGALAVAMGNVLGVSARCLRSGNVGKMARRLCGLDSLIMDALLADVAFMGGAISIVEFARALQKAEPLIATSLAYVLDDIGMSRGEVERLARKALATVESIA